MQRQGEDLLAEVAAELERVGDVVPHADGAVEACRGNNRFALAHIQAGDGLVMERLRQQPQLASIIALRYDKTQAKERRKKSQLVLHGGGRCVQQGRGFPVNLLCPSSRPCQSFESFIPSLSIF